MGCFLIISGNDLRQLNNSLKSSISVIGSTGPGNVKISVSSTMWASASRMASLIKENVTEYKVTSASQAEQKQALPMSEKFTHYMAALYSAAPALQGLIDQHLQSQQIIINKEIGKEAETIASDVLVKSGYIDKSTTITITKGTGPDVIGKDRGRNNVVVEVKASISDKSFFQLLSEGTYVSESSDGKGFRQASNDWIKVSTEKKGINVDLDKTRVFGVHINPLKDTVTIYRRMDENASQWKPLMTESLSYFNR